MTGPTARRNRSRETSKPKQTPKGKRVAPNKRTHHHRKPRSAGGDRNNGNISTVEHRFHEAYHRLFGPGLPHSVAEQLNEIWIDPDYVMIAMKRTDFERVERYLRQKKAL